MFNVQNAIIPKPQHIEDKNEKIKIGTEMQSSVALFTKGEGRVFCEAVAYLESKLFGSDGSLKATGSYKVCLEVNPCDVRFDAKAGNEAYIIDITSDGAKLVGFGEEGAYYAAVSFAALIHTENGEVMIPACYIYDWPYFKMRGHFMECRYGSDFMTLDDWKAGIDYLSEHKINNITLGLYGCWSRQYDGEFAEYQYVPLKKYPELKTPRHIKYYSAKQRKLIYKKDVLPTLYTDDYFGDMIDYAKGKNIEVVPLFNSFGHNTLIPRIFPEVSAVGEDGKPSGVGLCTANDKTYEIMFDIYDEIIDRYLMPNGITGFEIGFDEVVDVRGYDKNNLQETRSPFCKCEKCRDRSKMDITVDYLIKLVKYLKQKGMKSVYVYFDMLFEAGILNEELAQRFKDEDVYDVIVMDWWSYARRENIYNGHRDLVNSHFRSIAKPITGYFHWNMPTQMNEDVQVVTEVAMEHNFEGLVAYSAFEYCYDFNYRLFAECAWNPEVGIVPGSTLKRYAASVFPENAEGAHEALKAADEFMLGRYIWADNYCEQVFDYYNNSYLRPDLPYPQDYPAKAFRAIRDDEEKYLPYLKRVLEKSTFVYEWFCSNTSSAKGDIWKLISFTYKALCDEFLSIYEKSKAYNDGLIDTKDFANELRRLINQREKLIALCEDVRIEANQYTHIRNMSILRQAMCDLLTFIDDAVSNGKRPEIDIFSFGKYLSELSMFYR